MSGAFNPRSEELDHCLHNVGLNVNQYRLEEVIINGTNQSGYFVDSRSDTRYRVVTIR